MCCIQYDVVIYTDDGVAARLLNGNSPMPSDPKPEISAPSLAECDAMTVKNTVNSLNSIVMGPLHRTRGAIQRV